ncbi:MAG: uracil-xanthine permease family protein [Lachnospiraceae bacterium]|nr:uracil-xanthine permease family protein [Lachnospiraceae bacterium]
MSKQQLNTPDYSDGIMDARQLGTHKMVVLGAQHMFAMFGATVLVPALTGLDVSTTLLFAGLCTLLFHFISKGKVPIFLGSSFAFLAGYFAIAPNGEADLLRYASFGVVIAGLVYLVVAALIKAYGVTKVMRFFPPIVTGPIVIAIGLNLSSVAIGMASYNWWLALLAIAVIIVCNIWGKGMMKIIPIIIGIVVAYLAAIVTGNVDWTPVSEAAWIGLPIAWDYTVFSIFTGSSINSGLLLTAVITITPIALATIVEHIGDMSAISSSVGKNYIKDPGLHRTITGDGLASIVAALFGAPANTTYSENVGVLNLTKVYDPRVIRIGACFAILFAFSPKLGAVISCIPVAAMGGVCLILFGMIAAVGVRNVVENQVDFKKSRNVIIAALILVLSIGVNYSAAGAISFHIGEMTISLSGLATGALVGIIMNAILPGKDSYDEMDKEA